MQDKAGRGASPALLPLAEPESLGHFSDLPPEAFVRPTRNMNSLKRPLICAEHPGVPIQVSVGVTHTHGVQTPRPTGMVLCFSQWWHWTQPHSLASSAKPGNLPAVQLFPLLPELTIVTPRKKKAVQQWNNTGPWVYQHFISVRLPVLSARKAQLINCLSFGQS